MASSAAHPPPRARPTPLTPRPPRGPAHLRHPLRPLRLPRHLPPPVPQRPRPRRPGPAALVRAVDELHEAQQLWLAEAVAFSVRRRVEKAAGARAPDERPGWRGARRAAWPTVRTPRPIPPPASPRWSAPCGPPPGGLPLCGGTGPDAAVSWGSGRRRHLLCARCGSNLRAAVTAPGPALVRVRAERRRQVWRRTV
ncbi:hypothetical protein ACFQVA_12855 [Actinomadura keratinilytica]